MIQSILTLHIHVPFDHFYKSLTDNPILWSTNLWSLDWQQSNLMFQLMNQISMRNNFLALNQANFWVELKHEVFDLILIWSNWIYQCSILFWFLADHQYQLKWQNQINDLILDEIYNCTVWNFFEIIRFHWRLVINSHCLKINMIFAVIKFIKWSYLVKISSVSQW